MRKKAMSLILLGGMVFGFPGGCLDFSGLGRILPAIAWDAGLDVAWEFVWDNDSVFDLFEDGNVPATTD